MFLVYRVPHNNSSGQFQIYFTTIQDDLSITTTPTKISDSDNRAISPSITYNSNDSLYSLAWVDYTTNGEANIYFSRITPTGTVISQTNELITNTQSTYPVIVPVSEGTYALAWNQTEDGEYSVYFSIFYMGKLIEFELIAKPEKRYQNNFEEEFTMSIRRSGNTIALKTIEPSVNNLGESTDSYRYGDLDEQITYDISIKSNAHLRKTVTNVTLQEGINVIDFSDGGQFIKAGDINSTDGDNEVNETDLIALNNNFTNTAETRYDLNKDSAINAIDYSIIISNLNNEGDN